MDEVPALKDGAAGASGADEEQDARAVLLEAYRRHDNELRRFLIRRLGSPSLAADIAQDLFLKLLRDGEHPRLRDGKAYLFGMAANLATDRMRVDRRRDAILNEAQGLIWRQTEELTPERHAIAKAELRCMRQAIAELPPRCRRIFHLYRYEGRSQAEIAALLGIGLTTVYKDLKTTVQILMQARRAFRGAGHGGA